MIQSRNDPKVNPVVQETNRESSREKDLIATSRSETDRGRENARQGREILTEIGAEDSMRSCLSIATGAFGSPATACTRTVAHKYTQRAARNPNRSGVDFLLNTLNLNT